MRTYRFWVFHVDKDYGLDGFWYVEDRVVYSHGYAPGFITAVLNWVKHIPTAFAIRKMLVNMDKKSREQEKRNA